MNRLLKTILRTGLDILEQPDRVTEPVRDHMRETAEFLRRKTRREDHTLRYALTFAAGLGVGIGLGFLTASDGSATSGSTIAGRMRQVSDEFRGRTSSLDDLSTGTEGRGI